MAKLVRDTIDYRRCDILIPYSNHKKWVELTIREKISLSRISLLALLHHGHNKTKYELSEINEFARMKMGFPCKKIRTGVPIEVEDFYINLASEYGIPLPTIIAFYINEYVKFQFEDLYSIPNTVK